MPESVERFPIGAWQSVIPTLRFVYYGPVPAHGRRGWFTPGWFSCWFVAGGEARCRMRDGRSDQARRGEWLLMPPYLTRYQSIADDAVILSLAFSLEWPGAEAVVAGMPRRHRDSGALYQIALRVVQAVTGSRLPGPRREPALAVGGWLEAHAALADFVASWYALVAPAAADGERRRIDSRVRTARALLAAEPRMGALDHAELEAATGLGRVQLDRLFRRDLGHSIRCERDRHLLQRVLDVLGDPDRAVAAIAAGLGFTDSSHLCRWFKRQVGTTPEGYRRRGGL